MKGGIHSSLGKHYRNESQNYPYTIERIENSISVKASEYIDALENAKYELETKRYF